MFPNFNNQLMIKKKVKAYKNLEKVLKIGWLKLYEF